MELKISQIVLVIETAPWHCGQVVRPLQMWL